VITVEEGKTAETTYEVVEGMQFDKGYLSPYFINRVPEMDCVLEDACVLIHEKKVSNLRDLIPILEKITQTGRPLLIIDKDGELVIKKNNLWNADMETLLKEGCVEYVDALEQEYIQLAMSIDDIPTRLAEIEEANIAHQDAIERLAELEKIRDDPELLRESNIFDIEVTIASAKEAISQAAYSVKVVPLYTHSEIDPTAIMGLSASLIPLSNHNQAPRNTYQCKMASQSMGIYHSQNYTRFDTTAKVLAYPTRPLFETQMNEVLGLNELPAGSTVILAIMTYMGYNQEDAIIMRLFCGGRLSEPSDQDECGLLANYHRKHVTVGDFTPF